MGVLDRFLNAMKLNDNDGFDDDDFLDDEMDDFEEEAPKKRFFKKQNEEDDLGDLDMDEKVPSGKEKSKAKSFQKSGSTSSPRPYSTSSAKTSNSGKISQMRTTKKSVAGMEVCVIKPRSMEDTREITDTLLANCTVVLNMEGLDVRCMRGFRIRDRISFLSFREQWPLLLPGRCFPMAFRSISNIPKGCRQSMEV